MDYNRRIMFSYPFNDSDSFHACPGVHYYGDCITSLPPSSSSRGSTDQHPNGHINNFFIASGCLLAGAFFLALTYYAVLNHRWRRRRRPIAGGGGGSFVEEGDRDRRAWYIRSAGLDEATIESIAVYEYKAGDGLLPAADCSVCLGEFREGELVRQLPNCGHAFHVPCIDTWLQAHVNCPLCRAEIATPTADPADPPPPSRPAEWDSGSYDAQSNTQLGTQPLESDRGASEGEGEEGGMESGIRVVIRSSKSSSCPPSRVPSDVGGGEFQPVRRSVSMISSPLRAVSPTVEPEESRRGGGKGPAFGEDDSSKNRGKQGSAPRETSLQKGPQAMGKSQSSSGRGFLFSKYGRSRSSTLLPV